MTQLVRFLDAASKGVWANIRMSNNDPCWISVANSGILIKKSKLGLFGKTIFQKNISNSANTAFALSKLFQDDLTPREMQHPLLKAFTNAVLHCASIAEATMLLNREYPEPDLSELAMFLSATRKTET